MILRICVVIPTYNNPTTIASVIQDVLKETKFPIMVVDDGSDQPVQIPQDPRVSLVRLPENQGKGKALQIAFQEAIKREFTHVVTIDGDGQHYAREIHRVVEVARNHPWDLIIGHRRLNSATVPGASKFGRKFSNFWVNYQTGQQVLDSQSGFRSYPLFAVQNLNFFTKRYDFEIEVLIRLLWKHVHVREVEIDVFYPEKSVRVSHFHKFWDNARISILNTSLVTLALLRLQKSPWHLALSVGVGVFLGCTPFFGFHTFLAIVAAVLLRLNVLLVFAGSNISMPPLIPFLAIGAVEVGGTLFPQFGKFEQWAFGSFALGLILGPAISVVFYIFARLYFLREAPKRKVNWTGKSRGGWFGNAFLRVVLKYLGLNAGYFCLRFIIPYFYLFAPKARRALNEYWKILKPDMTWGQRQIQIIRHLYRFGQVLMDKVVQQFSKTKRFESRPHGKNNIFEIYSKRQPLILLGSHMGGWDLASSLSMEEGQPLNVHVVRYNTENPETGAPSIFEVHGILQSGGMVGLMGDRPMGEKFELVPLLGKMVPMDVTPFRIAAAAKVPMLFTFGFKADGRYYNFFADPAKLYQYDPSINREMQCYFWAKEFAARLEKAIREYPDQWFNFYPMWSSLPTLPNGTLIATGRCHLWEELNTPNMGRPELGPGPSKNV